MGFVLYRQSLVGGEGIRLAHPKIYIIMGDFYQLLEDYRLPLNLCQVAYFFVPEFPSRICEKL